MLFPKANNNLPIFLSVVLGVMATAVVIGFMAFSQSQALLAAATATPTKTPTQPATAIPTDTATPLPTHTPTPTKTPTHTPTVTPTPTATSTDTPTPLPPTPTFTLTPVIAETVILTETAAVFSAPLTTTLALTGTLPLTTTGLITPNGTPTPMPTSVPRTVLAPVDIPDYTTIEDHLWFSRPYTEAYHAWGSYYYPYGTNAQGRYFWHFGIDIAGSFGTPIVAVGDGIVAHAGPDNEQNLLGPWPDFYGQAVVIQQDRPWNGQPVYTLYGHVSRVFVQVGQQVRTGDLIAEVGQGGVAIGPHLHLEVRLGTMTYADTRNPDLWIQPDPGFGVIAGRIVDHRGYFVPQQLVTLHRADAPGSFWRQTYTYPDNVVNSDDEYAETFTFSDIPAGKYLLKTFFDGRQLTVPVAVTNGATSFALLRQDQPPLPPSSLTSVPEASPVIDAPPAAEEEQPLSEQETPTVEADGGG